jgi:hypothetical protein
MSNAFAPNRSYLCAERASHLTVKTYWLPVDVCGGGSLFDELGCLGRRGYTMNGFGGGADNIVCMNVFLLETTLRQKA